MVEDLTRQNGLGVYRGAEIIKDTLQSQKLANTATASGFTRVLTARLWYSASASAEQLRQFYGKTVPFVLAQEDSNGQTLFMQLSSVANVNQAIERGEKLILLVDIRGNPLSEAAQAAYLNELQKIKVLKTPDMVSKRRAEEIENLLREKILVQLSLRKIEN